MDSSLVYRYTSSFNKVMPILFLPQQYPCKHALLLVFLIVTFILGVDVSDIEKLKSLKDEIEHAIGGLEENLKVLQARQRQLEDEEANLHKQRVCFPKICIIAQFHVVLYVNLFSSPILTGSNDPDL